MPAPKKVAKRVPPAAKKVVARPAPTTPVAAPTATTEISQARVRAAAMPPIPLDGTSDLALAMREMLKGGETRQEVMHRVKQALAGKPTRTNKEKPVSTVMNHALNRAEAHGYRVDQHWILVPIPGYVAPEAGPATKPTKRTAKKAATKKTSAKTAAPAATKKASVPPPAKRVIRKPAAPVTAPQTATKRVAVKKPGVRGATP